MKIALFGSYGRGNFGDEAIADGIHKIITAIEPNAEVYLFTHDVESGRKLHPHFAKVCPMIATGVRSFLAQWRSRVWHSTLESIKNSNYIIIGGGGIFHDQEIGQKGLNPLFIWWLRSVLFAYFKKPILIWAVGVGPIVRKRNNFWFKGIIKRAHIVTVRDPDSAAYITQITATTSHVIPDPVWDLYETAQEKNLKTGILGINIRENKRLSQTKIRHMLFEEIQKHQTNYTISSIQLIPFALSNPDDTHIMQSLKDDIAQTFKLPVDIVVPSSPYNAFQLVQQCTAFIAMRFHSYIFAISAHTPCTLLSYSPKTDTITQHSLTENTKNQRASIELWRGVLSNTH